MTEEPLTRLGVSIKPGSEPIAGQIRLPDGSTTPFEGYVQLIAAVERAHVGAAVDGYRPAPGSARS